MRLLCAVDVHDRADHVLSHAIAWSRRLGALLDVVYVSEWSTEGLPSPPYPSDELDRLWASWKEKAEAERVLLDALLASVPADRRGFALFRGGRAADVLPDLARGYALVLVATHSRKGLERVLIGSVAQRVLRRSEVPVLVVGLGDPPVGEEGPLLVLAPVDDEDACAIPWIRDHLGSERVEVVHVTAPALPALFAGLEGAEERIERLRTVAHRVDATCRANGVEPRALHVVPRETSNAGDTIARVGFELGADVIVLPTHGRRGVERLLVGSVAERVVDRASSAVLVLPKDVITA